MAAARRRAHAQSAATSANRRSTCSTMQRELYVLELSSFQLETTESLSLAAAAVLNVTPDHLDRYRDIDAYAAAKARIYARCEVAVINLDDARVAAMIGPAQRSAELFAARRRRRRLLADAARGGDAWLARRGEALLPLCASMKLSGAHNAANALAALALGEALSAAAAGMLETLRNFAGLPHRSQWVADVGGVRYVDDSKGTNVGATLAAVAGMAGRCS